MIIDCIADLHGHYPKLEGGDLLIVAGDLTEIDNYPGYCAFNEWMIKNSRIYKKSVVIAGNHDNGLLPGRFNVEMLPKIHYLCDSGTKFEGLKIWGSPWTLKFDGMNPKCMAFTCDTEEELAEKWDMIPEDTNILVTHGPPYGILDAISLEDGARFYAGSKSLRSTVLDGTYFKNLKYHIFGHIHEMGGREIDLIGSTFVNASYVNEHYDPVNKPVRIVL